MSPPLPLDHLIISSNMDHRGLALHTTPRLELALSPSSSTHKQILKDYEPASLTLSLLLPAYPAAAAEDQSSRDNDDVSSFSNSVSVKREREEDTAANNMNDHVYEDVSNIIGVSGGGGGGSIRKKLRLNQEQSALLEDSFKIQSTLNPKQKEALARQLNLSTRQVEVWFQNRRARTKLKQTEVDCEFLKKCCERLAEENEKLHKELQQLKQVAQPLYMQLPPTRLAMCPSCERLSADVPPKNNHAKFLTSSKKRLIINPFPKPSAAC